jgi:hypothetical protein
MTSPAIARFALTVAAFLSAAAAGAAVAQQDSARVVGKVTSSYNGKPLGGVMISFPALKRFAVSDSTGAFALEGLPGGPQRLRIVYAGIETTERSVALKAGKTKRLAVLLDVEAVTLDPIVVEGVYLDTRRDLAGFYDRKRRYAGFNRFYTREDIERLRPIRISQLLSRDGISQRCTFAVGGCAPSQFSRGGYCRVAVFVDGMPFWEEGYDDLPMADVAAVEVYRGSLEAPYQFAGAGFGSAGFMRQGGTCGSVVIWTR